MPIKPRASGVPAGYFEGKTAIVTGAASGIGKALATALVQHGATCVFADIDEAGAKAAAEAASGAAGAGAGGGAAGADGAGRGEAVAAPLDITDLDAFTDLVAHTARSHNNALDLLFNNAGISMSGPAADFSEVHWRRVLDVNLLGVVHGVLAAYPLMIEQGHGHIVNTASLAGLMPGPMLAPYAMAKHGVVGLSTSLRMEAVAHGVRVSVACPGIIDTPLLDKGNPPDVPAVAEVPNGRAILERIVGKAVPAEELAEEILAGVARNRAFIVAPAHARRAWRAYRLAPALLVDKGAAMAQRILARQGERSR
jgi:NAD(P)-dependent dehydrogenase (short-subunit alcohol dehydrogenase family)